VMQLQMQMMAGLTPAALAAGQAALQLAAATGMLGVTPGDAGVTLVPPGATARRLSSAGAGAAAAAAAGDGVGGGSRMSGGAVEGARAGMTPQQQQPQRQQRVPPPPCVPALTMDKLRQVRPGKGVWHTRPRPSVVGQANWPSFTEKAEG
jgi:hypothetical protein